MRIEIVKRSLQDHQQTLEAVTATMEKEIEYAGKLVAQAVQNRNTVFFCGNGGSAADAQHLAAEFTGRFVTEREPLPAIALTTDTSALTAIGNDYGFDRVFARQLEALGKNGDLLIAISTSGNSENVLAAIEKAKEKGMTVIGMSGKDGGRMNKNCDCNLIVPSTVTARIQEMHILIGHIFCEIADSAYETNASPAMREGQEFGSSRSC